MFGRRLLALQHPDGVLEGGGRGGAGAQGADFRGERKRHGHRFASEPDDVPHELEGLEELQLQIPQLRRKA